MKSKKEIYLCQDCLMSYEQDELFWIDETYHHYLLCKKCIKNNNITEDLIVRKLSEDPIPKNYNGYVVKDLKIGSPTPKGNRRYVFINDKGNEVSLLLKTGFEKGFEPVLKK